MRSSRLRRICAVIVAALLVCTLPLKADAASSAEIKAQLDALKQEKREIEEQIKEIHAQYKQNEDEIADIIAQKNIIDQEVNLLAAQIRNNNGQISAYKILIADKQTELEAAQSRYEEIHEQSRLRIQTMEESSEISYWSILFHAHSFTDFLDRINMIEEIARSDQRQLAELHDASQAVKKAQDALIVEKTALEDVKHELDETQTALDAKRDEADALLQELLKKTNDLEALQEELEAQEQEFLAQIATKQQEYDTAKLAEYEAYLATQIPPATQSQHAEPAEDTKTVINSGSASWQVPVNYIMLTSPFGPREAPLAGASTYHQGVDLGAPRGTPVYATRSGIVTTATHSYSAGNYVQIDHQDGFRSVYMHLDTYCVSSGQVVSAGQQIGTVGTSGISNGYHLHFGISLNGTYVNPCKYVDFS